MRDKIWDFIGKSIYQVQVRGEDKVGFPRDKINVFKQCFPLIKLFFLLVSMLLLLLSVTCLTWLQLTCAADGLLPDKFQVDRVEEMGRIRDSNLT